jgi:hypothetical protein
MIVHHRRTSWLKSSSRGRNIRKNILLPLAAAGNAERLILTTTTSLVASNSLRKLTSLPLLPIVMRAPRLSAAAIDWGAEMVVGRADRSRKRVRT